MGTKQKQFKKALTDKEIKKVITDNYQVMDTHELANACDCTWQKIAGFLTDLSNKGLVVKTKKKDLKTKTSKLSKGKFVNYNGKGKKTSRDIIFDAIQKTYESNNVKLSSKILTLCADSLELEYKIMDELSKHITFDCVEILLDTYFNMLQKLAELRIKANTYNCSLIDVIKRAKTDEYDAIIMDYCGQFDKYFHDLKVVFNNDIVKKNGVISLTFSDRCGEDGIVKNINDMLHVNLRGTQVKNAIKHFILYCGGINYKIENVFKYNDTGEGMINIIVRRIR